MKIGENRFPNRYDLDLINFSEPQSEDNIIEPSEFLEIK
jgi:hypothetical protein